MVEAKEVKTMEAILFQRFSSLKEVPYSGTDRNQVRDEDGNVLPLNSEIYY